MRLNTLRPADGERKTRKRVGRGAASGWGKTCGRGHKGQNSRSGGFHKIGFEGGQMPLQRRLPKRGFNSAKQRVTAQITLSELAKIDADVIDIAAVREAGFIPSTVLRVRVIRSGVLDKPVSVLGLHVTAGAREVIEQSGGHIG